MLKAKEPNIWEDLSPICSLGLELGLQLSPKYLSELFKRICFDFGEAVPLSFEVFFSNSPILGQASLPDPIA